MKSIILEGIDGCGKSTLALQLGAHYGVGIHSIGGPPRNNDTAITMSRYQMNIADSSTVIFDRVTSMSRLCYEQDLSKLHTAQMKNDMEFLLKKCIVIWVTNPVPVNEIKEYDTDEHLKAISDNHLMIKHSYHDMMEKIPHFHYDYTESTFADLVAELNICR